MENSNPTERDISDNKPIITDNNPDISDNNPDISDNNPDSSQIVIKAKNPRKKRATKLKLKLNNIPDLTEENIESVFDQNFDKIDLDDPNYNTFLKKKELLNRQFISQHAKENTSLYPSLDDRDFNIKIAEKEEFNETKYDGTLYDIEKQAKILCEADFELVPHQLFVRNFLSFQTPYNSLLLYHGLGTGKTCSAITVAEEMRTYLKQLGIAQRIIVVASPNVQENFKLQLFDERKLKLVDGIWNLRACTGNKYLKEINPMNMKGLSQEKVIRQIKSIINNAYLFLGYVEFANFITKKSMVDEEDPKKRKREMIRRLKKFFNNRLIVIDEVHNIRLSDDKQDKRVAQELFKLVKYVDNLRLLFLSATPMYNSYKEVVWLLNVMNMNDNRSTIEIGDVFDKAGNLLISEDGTNIGEETLRRKSTGYVSFVRGENPYTFPYRIFPSLFSISNTFKEIAYPRKQLNGKEIVQPLEHLDVYVNTCGSFQEKGYKYIISQIKEKAGKTKLGLPSFENMDSFGYTILQKPLQALNMVYPNKLLDSNKPGFDGKILLGSEGLKRTMKFTETTNPPTRKNFEYKNKNDDFGEFFAPENIGNYSSKIKSITDNIMKSKGIVLVYSQFIDGGAVPIALALESLGFTRFGTKASNLFKKPPRKSIDVNTFLPRDEMENPNEFRPATYTMITGETALSPDKVFDLKNLTDEDNKNGEKIKVVIISMTGSEGIDFKNLRQVHILEPWYNLSLIEQIIGRAVRTCSHKQLPFKERNVEIFLYGTLMSNVEEEAVDLYIYRLAELKAVQIGRVSRILKESSVDCILNIDQTNFTEENMNTVVQQELSNKMVIDFPIGDKAKTVSCDYMDTCNFKCKPFKKITEEDIKLDTYNESFILINTDKIIQRIKDLFKERFFYKKDRLISEINIIKNYPLIQINAALNVLITDQNEYIVDKYNRIGHMINIDEYYLFQPIELNNNQISVYDRRNPVDYKHKEVVVPIQMKEDDTLKLKLKLKEKNVAIGDKMSTKSGDGSGPGDNGKTSGKTGNIIPGTMEIQVMEDVTKKYNMAMSDVNNMKRGEDDWYLFAAYLKTSNYLATNVGIDDNTYDVFIVAHILENMNFNESVKLLNHIYFTANNELKMTTMEEKIKRYYDGRIMENKGVIGIIWPKDNKQFLLVKGSNEWSPGEQEDYTDLTPELKKTIIPIDNYNTYVGFIGNFKNEYNIFKVKNMTDKRSKGARCDQSGKSDATKLLNSIIEESKYTPTNTKSRNKLEFCVLQEMYLRFYDKIKKNEKRWFLNPCEMIINNIEKLSV
jgi:superfamily II DNA or RNA helicase